MTREEHEVLLNTIREVLMDAKIPGIVMLSEAEAVAENSAEMELELGDGSVIKLQTYEE